jgi:hypothetical protein
MKEHTLFTVTGGNVVVKLVVLILVNVVVITLMTKLVVVVGTKSVLVILQTSNK